MSNEFLQFCKRFAPHFDGCRDKRWRAFAYIAESLFELKRPIGIIETGCARIRGNWAGDGQSTLLWDYIIERTHGWGYSFDINSEAVRVCREQVVHIDVMTKDSILGLRTLPPDKKPDLLFLDSFDWSEITATSSVIHHMGELAAIWDRLPKGCIVAVDDCHERLKGKHVMVETFFDMLGVEPVVDSYINVWVKP